MLALFLVFLISAPGDSVGAGPGPGRTPTPTPTSPSGLTSTSSPGMTPTPSPSPTATATSSPGVTPTPPVPTPTTPPLDLQEVSFDLRADFAGILRNDRAATDAFLATFDADFNKKAARDPSLRQRSVGFTLVYGYAPSERLGDGVRVAEKIYDILRNERGTFRYAHTTPGKGNWKGRRTAGEVLIYAYFYTSGGG